MSASGKNDPDERSQTAGASRGDIFCENSINLTLLDPPRYGWTAAGGVSDLLTPHEVSFMTQNCRYYVRENRELFICCLWNFLNVVSYLFSA